MQQEPAGKRQVTGRPGSAYPWIDSQPRAAVLLGIRADCSDEELDDLLGFARAHSPVCNTVCRPLPMTVERVRASTT